MCRTAHATRAGQAGKIGALPHFDSLWMNTMIRCALAALAFVATGFLAPSASAQALREFPPNTLRGTVVFGDMPTLLLNGKPALLSPGSRVRGANNMLVMAPTIVGAKLLVHYTLDVGTDRVRDIWILTPDEAAIKPWPTTLEQAQTWTWDRNTRTWIVP